MSARRGRARELGIPFPGSPGPLNAITDVAGVEVGHKTIRNDASARTGVSVVFPRGRSDLTPVFAGTAILNGTGELTGAHMVDETGLLFGPIGLTGTLSVGMVHHGINRWLVEHAPDFVAALPMVGETFDSLSDPLQFFVTPDDVLEALDGARSGLVEEGSVGAGAGTVCFGLKGGIGTSSRTVTLGAESFVVGALVQTNHGQPHQLSIAGVPVGELMNLAAERREFSSIIVVLATDAPLLPHQLRRLARRAGLGLARTGSSAGAYSGDLFVAISTHPTPPVHMLTSEPGSPARLSATMLQDSYLSVLFEAVVQATEEAIINSLTSAETTTGHDGVTVSSLPVDAVLDLLRAHGRVD